MTSFQPENYKIRIRRAPNESFAWSGFSPLALTCILVLVLSVAPLWHAGLYAQDQGDDESESLTLRLQTWQSSQTGFTIRTIESLRRAIEIYDEKNLELAMQIFEPGSHARIRLRYPLGDDGTRWARGVREWLIAMGVQGDHIYVEPQEGNDAYITLTVVAANGR